MGVDHPFPVPESVTRRFSSQFTSESVNYAWCRLQGYRERGDKRRDLEGKLYKISGVVLAEDDQDFSHTVYSTIKRLPDEEGLRVQYRFGNYEFEEGSCIQTARSQDANIGAWIEYDIDEDTGVGFA